MAIASPWPQSRVLRVLLVLWSAPIGVLGLLAQALFWAIGWGRPYWVFGACQLVADGPFARWMWSRGWAGFTFGWSIWYWTADAATGVSFRHEAEHVRQCLWLGPLMLIAYPIAMLVAKLRGRDPYYDNYFERRAQEASWSQ